MQKLTKEDLRQLFNIMRRRKIKQLCSQFAGSRDYSLWKGLSRQEADYAFIRAFNNAHLNASSDPASVQALAGKKPAKAYVTNLTERLEKLS